MKNEIKMCAQQYTICYLIHIIILLWLLQKINELFSLNVILDKN